MGKRKDQQTHRSYGGGLARAKSALWRCRLTYAVQHIATQHRGVARRHHRLCSAHVRHQSNGQRQSATHRPAAVDCRALLPLNARRKEAPGRPCSVRRTCPCQTRCWQGLFISNSRPFKPPLPAGFYRRSRDRLSAVPGPWRAIWSQPAALRWGFPANAGPLTIPSGGFSAGVPPGRP